MDYLVADAVSANLEIFCDGNNETLLPFNTHPFKWDSASFFLCVYIYNIYIYIYIYIYM